jgi:hypothetical protein
MKVNLIKKIGLGILAIGLGTLMIQAVSEEIDGKNEKSENYIYKFPTAIDFAGEKTPLHIVDVKQRFDREMLVNVNWHSNTYLMIKRANAYFPIIEPILKKNDIPDDFKYLAVIESGLTNARSSAGASGFWQFMSQTGKEYGMEVNENVDERYHLEMATEAACIYLKSSKEKLGSWSLAAAAYNAGLSGISNKLNDQLVTDYYDLFLVEETSRYVFRILAMKEIMKNPEEYGFKVSPEEKYNLMPTKKVEVTSSIPSLAKFAQENGSNYKALKLYNPWLRDTKLNNTTGKRYIIDIPTAGY